MAIQPAQKCGICHDEFDGIQPTLKHGGSYGEMHRVHTNCMGNYYKASRKVTCIFKCGERFPLDAISSPLSRIGEIFQRFVVNALIVGVGTLIVGGMIIAMPLRFQASRLAIGLWVCSSILLFAYGTRLTTAQMEYEDRLAIDVGAQISAMGLSTIMNNIAKDFVPLTWTSVICLSIIGATVAGVFSLPDREPPQD